MYLVFARAMLSWFVRDPKNPLMRLLLTLTEPILGPIRSLLIKLKIGGNMIDFSPLVALLLIQMLSAMVLGWF
jgi:YggT family protein